MSRLIKSLGLLSMVLVLNSSFAGAKTIKLVHSGTVSYASFYLTSSAGSRGVTFTFSGLLHSNAGVDANKALALAIPTKDSRKIFSTLKVGAQATDAQMKMKGAIGDETLLKTLNQDAGGCAEAALEGLFQRPPTT